MRKNKFKTCQSKMNKKFEKILDETIKELEENNNDNKLRNEE